MIRAIGLFICAACAALLASCVPQQSPSNSNSSDTSLGDLLATRPAPPPVTTGQVSVDFTNESQYDAEVRVTMRAVGELVLLTTRTIRGGGKSLLVGPDFADTVVVEITQKSEPPRTLPAKSYVLGADFGRSGIIRVVITDPVSPIPSPLAPQALRASKGTVEGAVDVTWEVGAASSQVSSFVLFRSTENRACVDVLAEDLAGSARSFHDESVEIGTTYYYSLRARGPGGQSVCSGVDSGFAPVPPPVLPEAPRNVAATDGTLVGSIRVTWLPAESGGQVASFTIYRSNTQEACQQVLIADLPAGATSYSDSSVEPNITYYYSVRAVGPAGQSACSNVDPGSARPPELPQPFTVVVDSVQNGACVTPPADVRFRVQIDNPTAESVVTVTADPDDDETNGNELPVVQDEPADVSLLLTWHVPEGTPPASYRLRAHVTDGARSGDGVSDAAVRVNAEPQILLDGPINDLLVTRGHNFTVSWVAVDPDDDARITILLDTRPDGPLDGDELPVASNISEDDAANREIAVSTLGLEFDEYYVRALIQDCAVQKFSDNAIHICLGARLAGQMAADQLLIGEATRIAGQLGRERRLGASIDIREDLDGDGNLSEVLVGDPEATLPISAGGQPAQAGAVYYFHRAVGPWPDTLSALSAQATFVGDQEGARAGERVASLPRADALDQNAHFLIGSPQSDGRGRVTFVRSIGAAGGAFVYLSQPVGSPLGEVLNPDASFSHHLGIDMTSLGDVDGSKSGSGDRDMAIADYDNDRNGQGTGAIAMIPHGVLPATVDFDEVASELGGITVFGTAINGHAGFAVVSVPDVNGDGLDEIAIGAPGGYLDPEDPRAVGLVYLIFGRLDLFTGGDIELDIEELTSTGHGLVFAGELEGSQTGSALAAGDFDGDGETDLLIGAPEYDSGAGRVYLLSRLSNPDIAPVTYLEDIGDGLPGAVFAGAAGQNLGAAVANAGRFDLDGVDDLLLGAPGESGARGEVYLLYGGSTITGHFPLDQVGTCSVEGLRLTGPRVNGRFGAALAGHGNLDGQGGDDIAIGAPGRGSVVGEAYLIFGRAGAR